VLIHSQAFPYPNHLSNKNGREKSVNNVIKKRMVIVNSVKMIKNIFCPLKLDLAEQGIQINKAVTMIVKLFLNLLEEAKFLFSHNGSISMPGTERNQILEER
jgi:hypothetical protein